MSLTNGVALDWGARTTHEFLGQASALEGCGFSTLWMSNNRFEQDVWVAATALARAVAYAHIGTFVADPYTQHPAILAAAIATLDLLAEKPPILGLGAGGTGFREMGLTRIRPAARLEAATAAVRELLAGHTVTSTGDIVCNDAQLGFRPLRRCPVVVGTRGDRVLAAAGRTADGVMISTYAQPNGLQRAMRIVRQAAREARRAADEVQILARVDVGLPNCESEVKQALAMAIVTSYPDTRFLRVQKVCVPDELLDAAARRDMVGARRAADLLSDEAVEKLAWVGGEAKVRAHAQAFADVGVDGIVIVPHGRTPDEVLDCMFMCARALGGVRRPAHRDAVVAPLPEADNAK